jgi:Vault protein inter-alpha-trypsin domain/von Willebrand factor type A domain
MNRNIVAGIVWDSREPIPPEFLGDFRVIEPQDRNARWQHFQRGPAIPQNVNNIHQVRDGVEDFVIRELGRNILPPLSSSLRARVIQDTAKITVTQLFWNNTNTTIPKGSYTFPLPVGCTVTDFSCRVGTNRIVRAKVKPKQEARDTFDRAVRNNQTAGLLEQATPEIFTTTLGNIPANAKLRAAISFITLLKHGFADRRSTTTLTIPTYIAARYGNPPPELQNAIPTGISQKLGIEVEVLTAERVQDISSSTHTIAVERRVGRNEFENWQDFTAAEGETHVQTALVKLRDGLTFLTRDFVLDITTEPPDGSEAPHAWLEVHPSFANHKAVMLTIPPSFMLRNESAGGAAEIIFVADRSGSMIDKMESLKSAMDIFLRSIPPGRRFNIWCFGDRYNFLWPNSQDYQQQTLDSALGFVKREFKANMGGTELLPALKGMVEARDRSRMTDIVVLTDGEVWRLDETIEFVQQTRRDSEGRVRVFALGVGNAVSHELIEELAKAGGGYAEVIPAASQGGWEDRLVSMLRATLSSHVGPLQIELDGPFENVTQGEQPLDGKVYIYLAFKS